LKKDLNPLAITPTLQYSGTPKLIELNTSKMDYRIVDYRSKEFIDEDE
jgi:hypothetical protein